MSDLRRPYGQVEYACLEGRRNMALDSALLARCEQSPASAFLRFYTWTEPTLSMGRLEPQDAVDTAAAERDGVAIVRRPTGGRAVLHGDDLTYTVVLPRPDDAGLERIYRLVSEVLVEGLSALGARLDIERGRTGRLRVVQRPCFASVSRHEVTYGGRKVIGSAQRIGERAVLQHGSIPLGRGYLGVVRYMNVPPSDRRGLLGEMKTHTACLSEVLGKCVEPEAVADALGSAFRRRFGCDPDRLVLADFEGGDRLAGGVTREGLGAVNASDKSP
jgi:lipoate-protein ligase A